MTRETVYATAWRILKSRLSLKTSWGRNELASLMAECVEEAINTIESNEGSLNSAREHRADNVRTET